ncbi:MAG: molybdopterin synthase sulfur carrier subunit [bacterium]|nr:MAG: molybdopterin synthase sulfur carrier subunit [bacterium]
MLIKVKFFASLRDDFGKEAVCEVDQNSRVEDLFHKMKIPKDLTKIVLVNGKSIEGNMDYLLSDGDTISIFPPIGGG